MIRRRTQHKELADFLKTSKYKKYVSLEMRNLGDVQILKDAITYMRGVFS